MRRATARISRGSRSVPVEGVASCSYAGIVLYAVLRIVLRRQPREKCYAVITLMVQAEVRPMTWAIPAFAPSC
jgi:hypothetical protein